MRIAVLDDYLRLSLRMADWSVLDGRAEVTVIDRPLAVPDEAAAVLAPFDVLCTLRERMALTATLIERLPALRYIVVTGRRTDTVDVAAAARRGVLVSNTGVPGEGSAGAAEYPGSVGELTWALILALTRGIAFEDRMMRQGGWQHGAGITLRGRTLGVLGLGRLGRAVAAIGAAFGMDVIAWSPNLTDARAAAAGVRRVDKATLFAVSDVLTLHLALADSTRGIVGAQELALMKPTAFLVNTARAALVDEAALMAALEDRRIAGAGLDVYWQEPLPPDHPIRRLPNVVLSPHLGYFTEETLRGFWGEAVRLIAAWLDGRPERLVAPPADG